MVVSVATAFLSAVAVSACVEAVPTAVPTSTATVIPATPAPPTRVPIPTYTPTPEPIVAVTNATPSDATPTSEVNPTSTPTSAPVPTNTPTSTSAPSNTPTPTLEPTSTPTSTPQPTNTPAATATPTDEEIAIRRLAKELPWFVDPPDQLSITVRTALLELWELDTNVATAIARFSWLAEGVTADEVPAVAALHGIARLDPALVLDVADLQWIADGVTSNEVEDLRRLTAISGDSSLAKAVLSYLWVQDGLDRIEQSAWRLLLDQTDADSQTVQAMTALRWLADGITQDEVVALEEIDKFIDADETLARQVLGYQWLQKEIGHDEAQALYGLADVAARDLDSAKKLADAPWLKDADRVTSHQWEPVQNLGMILWSDLNLARQLTDLIVEQLGHLERSLFYSLAVMSSEKSETFDRLRQQDWFADGLSREEIVFLVTSIDIIENSPRDFDEMLVSRYTQSKSVNLPLSGDINIWAIQKTQFPEGEDVTLQIEVALRALEELTLTPLRVKDVIALFVIPGPDSNFVVPASNLDVPWPREAHGSGHIRMTRDEFGEFDLWTLFHELGHYQFAAFPAWFVEGGASFAASYIWHNHAEGSVELWAEETEAGLGYVCSNGATNLHELGDTGIGYRTVAHIICFYDMGEIFLSKLYHSLGMDATAAALRDIIAVPTIKNRTLTSKDVFLAFERNVRQDQHETFLEIFRDLHGGPLADDYVGVEDLEGDDLATAFQFDFNTVTPGSLDHPFDVDYFSITLSTGQTVLPAFKHEIHTELGQADLIVTLTTPDGSKPEGLESLQGAAASMQVKWVAPADGDHYFALESSRGITGTYEIHVGSGDTESVSDEQTPDGASDEVEETGSNFADASVINLGETLIASIDDPSDIDYFKFDAVAGQVYEVFVWNASLEHSKVLAFGSDGLTQIENASWSYGFDQAHVTWRATESGIQYLEVLSPEGNIGGYQISLTEFTQGGDDHGNDAFAATTLQLDEIVSGNLDFPHDIDFFVFKAEQNQVYNILLDHLTLSYQPVTIFASDGAKIIHEYAPWGGFHTTGSLIPWQAPESGEYFLKFHSRDGNTGSYKLAILSSGTIQDAHGDDPSTATELSIGQEISGNLDQAFDIDYFKFEAQKGTRYFIALDYDRAAFTSQEPDPRIGVHLESGLMEEYRDVEDGERQSGRFFTWEGLESQTHYIIIWSPKSDIGPYTLTLGTGGLANN